MANVWTIRIHEKGEDFRARVVEWFRKQEGSYVCAYEKDDCARPHYQGWLRTHKQQQTIRKSLKAAFPEVKGNVDYGINKVKDFDAYARYILKGTKEELAFVVCHCGIDIDEEYLAREHRAYWSTHDKPGKSNKCIVDDVAEWAATQEFPDGYVKKRAIATRVCDTIVSKKKPMTVFYARGIFNTVMYRLDAKFREDVVEEILSKM